MAHAVMYFELATNRPDVKREGLIEWGRLLVSRGEYAKAIPKLPQAQEIEFKENVAKFIDQLEQVVKNQL